MSQSRRGYKSYLRGLWAERLAYSYLWIKNYRILSTRYKTPVGEIDIVAQKGNTLCFIEVKYRRSQDDAALSISSQMKQRISRAADFYCMKNSSYVAGKDIRFDAMLIAPFLSIRHLDNAWYIGDN